MARKSAKKADCDHLNIGQTIISGQEVAICKDCNDPVDMKQFEAAKDPATELLPFIKNGKEIIKVVQYNVESTVKLPKLDPFFPVFGLQNGDIVVIYRPKT